MNYEHRNDHRSESTSIQQLKLVCQLQDKTPSNSCGLRPPKLSKKVTMLKITRAKNAKVVFTVSGGLDLENLAELKTLIDAEAKAQPIVLDLTELTLVDEDAIQFLGSCESDGMVLRNCPAFVREWIARERGES